MQTDVIEADRKALEAIEEFFEDLTRELDEALETAFEGVTAGLAAQPSEEMRAKFETLRERVRRWQVELGELMPCEE